jgi:ABC-type antimicrobial peptide transport system permease subunit
VGVRMALGADRRQIARMILLQGLDPVISGLVLGLILGAAARSVFQPLIVEYFPKFDPVMFVLVPIPFAVAAAIACYLPARRASRVDPLVALRDL